MIEKVHFYIEDWDGKLVIVDEKTGIHQIICVLLQTEPSQVLMYILEKTSDLDEIRQVMQLVKQFFLGDKMSAEINERWVRMHIPKEPNSFQ